uniref:Delta(3,5)-Delta(2,4)-dienoyl-CoA isomerase n=1 Tax=Schistocephalus solidus TaxID=70667 RepID=A0A0V0J8M1_SCHSO
MMGEDQRTICLYEASLSNQLPMTFNCTSNQSWRNRIIYSIGALNLNFTLFFRLPECPTPSGVLILSSLGLADAWFTIIIAPVIKGVSGRLHRQCHSRVDVEQ